MLKSTLKGVNKMNNNEEKVKKIMNNIIANSEHAELSKEDEEFNKYCKLYKEKFGKKAYIAEPNGSKQQTMEAIKTCLEEDKDLLDKILYPNFDNKNLY